MQRDNDRGSVLKMKPPRCAVIISAGGKKKAKTGARDKEKCFRAASEKDR